MKLLASFASILFFASFYIHTPVFAQYPTSSDENCSCLGNGNCSDSGPGGTNCFTGTTLSCSSGGCASGYRPVEQRCGSGTSYISCGYKCIYEQSCATGFCQSNPPTINCTESDGSFLCGDGGCNSCQRLIRTTTCNGSYCQSFCSNDDTCGVGCGGGGSVPSPTSAGGSGPTSTPSCSVTAPTAIAPIGTQSCPTAVTVPVAFDWSDVPSAATYWLRIDDQTNGWVNCGSGPSNPGDYCISGITNSYYIQNLTANRSYQWWVTQINSCGQESGGTVQSFTIPAVCAGGPTSTPFATITPTPTPVPGGAISARAVQADPSDTSCTTIRAIPPTDTEINGTLHQFTSSSASTPSAQTQINATYVTFSDVLAGSYTLDPILPSANWVLARACWRNLSGAQGEGLSSLLGMNETLIWDVGYTLGTAWVQTEGGDVYASGSIRSYIPAISTRVFSRDGDGGYPGIVTYGSTYDFDSEPDSQGDTLVSNTGWIVGDSRTTVNYYDYFYRRFGSPTTPSSFANLLAVTKPASSQTPYYVVGDMTTSGTWTVGAGETIVFIVDGDLTIGGRINITGNGFVAFIVNGNISVSSSVGTTAGSNTLVVEGIYITSPTGVFETGVSTAAASARFNGKGMFIAGNFLLQRDLEGFGAGNTANPAERFYYNPQLILTMPEAMQELPVVWQEVAP